MGVPALARWSPLGCAVLGGQPAHPRGLRINITVLLGLRGYDLPCRRSSSLFAGGDFAAFSTCPTERLWDLNYTPLEAAEPDTLRHIIKSLKRYEANFLCHDEVACERLGGGPRCSAVRRGYCCRHRNTSDDPTTSQHWIIPNHNTTQRSRLRPRGEHIMPLVLRRLDVAEDLWFCRNCLCGEWLSTMRIQLCFPRNVTDKCSTLR